MMNIHMYCSEIAKIAKIGAKLIETLCRMPVE